DHLCSKISDIDEARTEFVRIGKRTGGRRGGSGIRNLRAWILDNVPPEDEMVVDLERRCIWSEEAFHPVNGQGTPASSSISRTATGSGSFATRGSRSRT